MVLCESDAMKKFCVNCFRETGVIREICVKKVRNLGEIRALPALINLRDLSVSSI